MRSKNGVSLSLVALALTVGACAQTGAQSRYTMTVPAGRAGQPASWQAPSANTSEVRTASAGPRGQAAQPGSWNTDSKDESLVYSYAGVSVPQGQAAQPYAWPSRAQ